MPTNVRSAISPRGGLFRIAVVAIAGFGLGSLASRPSAAQPIIVEDILRSTPGGLIRGQLARVDLLDPRVSVITTTPPVSPPAPGADSNLVTVPAWRTSVNA